MWVKICLSVALTAFAAVQPALADENERTESAACALHIWVSRDFHTTYYGWFHGGTVDGSLKQRSGYVPIPTAPLTIRDQGEALRKLPVADLLGLHGFVQEIHDQPLSQRAIRETNGRHAQGTPACYAELIVDDLIVQENVLSGKALNVIYRFRRFDGGDVPTRTFGAFVQQPLRLFPPADPARLPAALDELAAAFERSVAEFGTKLQAPPKRRDRR
jgi:hypothetical protein